MNCGGRSGEDVLAFFDFKLMLSDEHHCELVCTTRDYAAGDRHHGAFTQAALPRTRVSRPKELPHSEWTV